MGRTPQKFRKTEAGNQRQRGKSRETRHWLGAGDVGQDDLLLEVVPHLFFLDREICKLISSCVHRYQGLAERPLVLFVPFDGALTWHIGFIAACCDLCIFCEDPDPALEDAAPMFDASIVSGVLPSALHGEVDLVIALQNDWDFGKDILQWVKGFEAVLSPEGRAFQSFEAITDGNELSIWLSSGESFPLASLQVPFLASLPLPKVHKETELEVAETVLEREVSEFYRRHKKFFGKNAKDLLLRRIAEPDFREQMIAENRALLVEWGYE